MTIVIKYVRKRSDGKEEIRQVVLPAKRMTRGDFNWNEAVSAAIFHKREGERIVALIEGGYH